MNSVTFCFVALSYHAVTTTLAVVDPKSKILVAGRVKGARSNNFIVDSMSAHVCAGTGRKLLQVLTCYPTSSYASCGYGQFIYYPYVGCCGPAKSDAYGIALVYASLYYCQVDCSGYSYAACCNMGVSADSSSRLSCLSSPSPPSPTVLRTPPPSNTPTRLPLSPPSPTVLKTPPPSSIPPRLPPSSKVGAPCGLDKGGAVCPDGLCCSPEGYCGNSEQKGDVPVPYTYCGRGCQKDYGKCDCQSDDMSCNYNWLTKIVLPIFGSLAGLTGIVAVWRMCRGN
jgi:hypothetical protein